MTIDFDLHTHTTYSDGYDMREMAEAAERAGLAGIGFTDHCLPYEDPFGRRTEYDLEETYVRRRRDIDEVRASTDVDIYDAVELNYDPNHESEIRTFLDEAGFDYAIGSVHYADEYYVMENESFVDRSESVKRTAIETYVDWQVRLIESGLFDVIGHVDVTQRRPSIRGAMNEGQYRRIAEALAGSDTALEINAGRLDRSYATVHPHPDFLSVFRDGDISLVAGTDAHAPDQVQNRNRLLSSFAEETGLQFDGIETVLTRE
ncbi:histidinol-phosphatase HisJ family protein [Natrarchaeobius oligotrophus]|uniref:histidinol-phosphatase n=1 Tax=Natrarchaeobius chitinivorans TaxID=1679083 RepID=A0A3N6MM76_NATCH|nr:histidinol-phosphatase HisJ family protein [Natrarchaeobius chitinivorans]RQH02645.1 histidinol-phosphatase HisJ family protein [Natrarchaeobius chitinivorans]